MIIIVQRVTSACVSVGNTPVSSIKKGYLLLVGIQRNDTEIVVKKISEKLLKLRIMADKGGKMNKNIIDAHGSILAVSQFTLCADTKKGNRPSFLGAMEPESARSLFDLFISELRKAVLVKTGIFGAYMRVDLVNDGPTTIILNS